MSKGVEAASPSVLTRGEHDYCERIRRKDLALRSFLRDTSLAEPPDARSWFNYMTQVKDILGNINNGVGFLATLLAKEYLAKRYGMTAFDAADKAQGAPGRDIDARAPDGTSIHCEIKTTRPYQPGFGAQQKHEIIKDLKKLAGSSADHKLMMVTDNDSFATLCKTFYASHAPAVEIVNLLTGEAFHHE
jgi:hypothetical protein